MFQIDTHGIYRVREWEHFSWLDHGFGTRTSAPWPPSPLISLKQIHSAEYLVVEGGEGCAGSADALISATPGLYLSVRTADCLPLLIADERNRAIAAVHAGWRGSAAQIAVRAVEALRMRFSSRPEDLHVAIGPGICGNCYTVGKDVADQFRSGLPCPGDRVDLEQVNRLQLIEAGVQPLRIQGGAPCTFCQPDQLHSHRRGSTGRMVSAIALRPAK